MGRLTASSGLKMFLALTLALLPLGLIALFASLHSIRSADVEKDALLKLAATQSARKLSSEITVNAAMMRVVVNQVASGETPEQACGRADRFLKLRGADVGFAIFGPDKRPLCVSANAHAQAMQIALQRARDGVHLISRQQMIAIRTRSDDQRLLAIITIGRDYLENVTDPVTTLQSHEVSLREGDQNVIISDNLSPSLTNRVTTSGAAIDGTQISLVISILEPPLTLVRALSAFLPLVMWLAAAAIGWLVVDRLLLRHVISLRRLVASWQPGEIIQAQRMTTPAQEINDLGDTFQHLSRDITTHEAEMAQSLARQQKLTREVHHRVKNNLQIIASLINLHSRSASTPEASQAYGSIQRRVDALSVVHRNHYAEMEENRGLSIRALVSELSASLRGSAPDSASRFVIQVNSENLFILQDVAVPVAFLITELVEMAMLVEPTTAVRISVTATGTQTAELAASSTAYMPSDRLTEYLTERFGRVLTGLSRQLRAPLRYDPDTGEYAIAITAIA